MGVSSASVAVGGAGAAGAAIACALLMRRVRVRFSVVQFQLEVRPLYSRRESRETLPPPPGRRPFS